MNGARYLGSLKPISRERQLKVAERETGKVEARLRRKIISPTPDTSRTKTSGIAETGAAEAKPETSAAETRETREALREQRRNLVLLMAQLEREALLDELGEDDLDMIEAKASKLVRGELPVGKWRAVLTNLKARRALRYPAPNIERRHEPPRGW